MTADDPSRNQVVPNTYLGTWQRMKPVIGLRTSLSGRRFSSRALLYIMGPVSVHAMATRTNSTRYKSIHDSPTDAKRVSSGGSVPPARALRRGAVRTSLPQFFPRPRYRPPPTLIKRRRHGIQALLSIDVPSLVAAQRCVRGRDRRCRRQRFDVS